MNFKFLDFSQRLNFLRSVYAQMASMTENNHGAPEHKKQKYVDSLNFIK